MFKNVYKGKNVLITGNTGFKGSWLSEWLVSLGANVAGYSIGVPSTPSHFEELHLSDKIQYFVGDIRSYEQFKNACVLFKPEFIFHLAAQPLVRESYVNPRETFEVNVSGTLNVLEVIREMSDVVKVGVIITSDKCYDNVEWIYGYRENDRLGGEDPYSGSKGAAELVANSYMKSYFKTGFPNVATTRAGNVIGGGDWAKDRIIPDIVRSWSVGKPVEVRNISSTRPWQHVLEPLSGYLCLGANLYTEGTDLRNQAFNFGPDSRINKTVGELIAELEQSWDQAPGMQYVPLETAQKESVLLKLSCEKANIQLSWFPVLTFEETIRFTSTWYKSYYEDVTAAELTRKQINEYCNLAAERKLEWALS
ncbi:MAG: CDP-glucose 4,6-dehydratase [Chitinophagaceae bacterium]|nr:CDP-glucose 4,6-dehydratase [Chitinophagaceae bacterium]MCA6459660.1 CDP-glucose 4,6-dehydratase [Chitinophagaceae bacterium]MCA6464527.1 CDP-glucose 4,6-dehydratase [Chitinophagaceae bacterium]